MPAEDFELGPETERQAPPAAVGSVKLAIPIVDEESSRNLIAALRDPDSVQLFDLTLVGVRLTELPNLEVTVDGMTMSMSIESSAVLVARSG